MIGDITDDGKHEFLFGGATISVAGLDINGILAGVGGGRHPNPTGTPEVLGHAGGSGEQCESERIAIGVRGGKVVDEWDGSLCLDDGDAGENQRLVIHPGEEFQLIGKADSIGVVKCEGLAGDGGTGREGVAGEEAGEVIIRQAIRCKSVGFGDGD